MQGYETLVAVSVAVSLSLYHTVISRATLYMCSHRRTSSSRSAELLRLGLLMALTMTLHNFPEGFAVYLNAKLLSMSC